MITLNIVPKIKYKLSQNLTISLLPKLWWPCRSKKVGTNMNSCQICLKSVESLSSNVRTKHILQRTGREFQLPRSNLIFSRSYSILNTKLYDVLTIWYLFDISFVCVYCFWNLILLNVLGFLLPAEENDYHMKKSLSNFVSTCLAFSLLLSLLPSPSLLPLSPFLPFFLFFFLLGFNLVPYKC